MIRRLCQACDDRSLSTDAVTNRMAYHYAQLDTAFHDFFIDPTLRPAERQSFTNYEASDNHMELINHPSMTWSTERYLLTQQDRPLYVPHRHEELDQTMNAYPATVGYPDFHQHHHHQQQSYHTPYGWSNQSASSTGLDSCASASACMSDSPGKSPTTSPVMTAMQPFSADIVHSCGSGSHLDQYRQLDSPAVSVAMNQVQLLPDNTSDPIEYEHTVHHYNSYCPAAEEGFHPIGEEVESYPTPVSAAPADMASPEEAYSPRDSVGPEITLVSSTEKPSFRTRRNNSGASITTTQTSTRPTHKITKARTGRNRVTSSSTRSQQHAAAVAAAAAKEAAKRAFTCDLAPYGCASTFASKNEWKRHINTQHMRWGYWRCDQCDSSKAKPNDFNRKDLYIQHVRRMHPTATAHMAAGNRRLVARRSSGAAVRTSEDGRRRQQQEAHDDDDDEAALNAAATRCYHIQRQPPASTGCPFCPETFEVWDDRLEHIGRHMEVTKKQGDAPVPPSQWRPDSAHQQWLLDVEIITRRGNKLRCAEHKE